ncbi:hypothetical protein ID852_03400 [Xenorhabdus sp. 42]|uniref:hypothetical protein n=1 Tax=Xenorhabdus szentirmaii TaxID=290112 RepID=UPI0019A95826|nr:MULTISPECIES: hypothetical protein [unclassified Xenorhabdus]MBD2780818.1 hypothetical protein [Xenorhabdus sp. 38]MBD2819752.1 hypothetical protein [Xenorhabdus sp. 42]
MNTHNSNTDTPLIRHEKIVNAFSELARLLPAEHGLKELMFLLADNLSVSFSTMKDYLQNDEDIL